MRVNNIVWTESNAEQLRMKRAKEQLTQNELAKKLGVNLVTISSYEKGEKENIRIGVYFKLINYLANEINST